MGERDSLEEVFVDEITLERISHMILEGYTSGKTETLNGDNIFWELKFNIWED